MEKGCLNTKANISLTYRLPKILALFLFVFLLLNIIFPFFQSPVYAANAAMYSVTYNANGGSGAPSDSNSYPSGATVTILPQGGVNRDGYIFSGWSTASGGGGIVYQPGNTMTITSNVTLYAYWTPIPSQISSIKTFSLYYDANGGTGGPVTEHGFTYDERATVSYGKPTRPGYTFLYWATQANGGGTIYGPGNTFAMQGDTTLYAQWKSNSAAATSRKSSIATATTTATSPPIVETSSSEEIISSSEDSSSEEISTSSISSSSEVASSSTSGNVLTNVGELPPDELLAKLKEKNVSFFFSIPISNGGYIGTWSLFSLFSMFLTLFFSGIILLRILLSSRKISAESYTDLKINTLGIFIVLLGPLSALSFLLIEKFSRLMVWFNSYSLLFGFLLFLSIILSISFSRKKKNPTSKRRIPIDDDDDFDDFDEDEYDYQHSHNDDREDDPDYYPEDDDFFDDDDDF